MDHGFLRTALQSLVACGRTDGHPFHFYLSGPTRRGLSTPIRPGSSRRPGRRRGVLFRAVYQFGPRTVGSSHGQVSGGCLAQLSLRLLDLVETGELHNEHVYDGKIDYSYSYCSGTGTVVRVRRTLVAFGSMFIPGSRHRQRRTGSSGCIQSHIVILFEIIPRNVYAHLRLWRFERNVPSSLGSRL